MVACPCALVISTPVTIVSALAGGARRGILIKGGLHLENAGRAGVVALDKTGTLTEGRPEVAEVLPLDGVVPSELIALAAAAEARSQHPLACAVLRHAEEQGMTLQAAADVQAITGRGRRARAAFVVLAVLGHATLWMAVAADMGASLLVVMKGLRALRT